MFRFLINLENSFLNFGTKGTGEGQFKRPEDIAIDPQGRIFVCDTGNSRIQIFSKND
jgi:secreted PhoX family phosphatase